MNDEEDRLTEFMYNMFGRQRRMPDETTTTFDQLHDQTSKALVEAYQLESLVYTGSYLTKVVAVYEKTNSSDDQYNPGRFVVNLKVEYRNPNDPTEKVGEGFINTSPEIGYTRSGKLDASSNRYMELARALGLSGIDYKEVYEKAQQQMFMTRVNETYNVPEEDLLAVHQGKRIGDNGTAWVTLQPEETDARHEYMDIGLEPRIMVQRIYAVKGSRRTTRSGIAGQEPVNPETVQSNGVSKKSKKAATVADDDIPF